MKIKKGYVYVVKDIDINGKCKHDFVSLSDIPIDLKGTKLGAFLDGQNETIKKLTEQVSKLTKGLEAYQNATKDSFKEIINEIEKEKFL